MKKPYAQQKDARQQNVSALLHDLWYHSPLSRAMLAQRNGLTKATVSAISDDLVAQNLLREVGQDRTGNGRPGNLLEINPAARCAIGVEISTNYVAVLLANFGGQALWQRSTLTPIEAETFNADQSNARGQAETLIAQAIEEARTLAIPLLGIGVGIPGLMDFQPIRDRWEARFSLPVRVENKARVAAMAEALHGSARGVDNFVYVSMGTDLHASVDAAVMMDGTLFRGANGLGVDAGHMIIDPQGALCSCGQRGCWQAITDVGREVEMAGARLAAGEASVLQGQLLSGNHEIDHRSIHQAALQRDPLALDIVRSVMLNNKFGIVNLISLFDPELVVIGYANIALPTEYQARMQALAAMPELDVIDAVTRQLAHRHLKPPTMRLATCGAITSMLGAATLLVDEFLRMPRAVGQ